MPVEIKARKSRPVASKQQFRDEIISRSKIAGRLFDLTDKILDPRLSVTAHDRAVFADLRTKWDAIKRSEGM